MTGDRSQLTNFVSKFLGTVKFRNDHVAKIMGYGDYQIGNVTISRLWRPSSTTVDQDAPSPSNSQTTPETPPPVIPNDVEEDNHDIEVTHMGNDSYFVSEHNSKWTKDHPLENIIGELDRPISTRLQLHEQALFCNYDAFLTAVEPKKYKDALTQSCWIKAM
ncbi:hypothetical protein Tco_1077137 [Tanacetum coccineum]